MTIRKSAEDYLEAILRLNITKGYARSVDIAAALSVLGYSPAEIASALRKVDVSSLTVEEAIREILKTSLK